jgi:hypothetical protein
VIGRSGDYPALQRQDTPYETRAQPGERSASLVKFSHCLVLEEKKKQSRVEKEFRSFDPGLKLKGTSEE